MICATFLGFLGIGTVLPALAPHIRRDLGGSDVVIGSVIGTFSLVALGSRFLSGPFADRRGRKMTFLVGLAACGLAGCIYMLPLGIASAYGGRAFQGFGEACLYTGAAAWAVEVAGVERSSQALGYISSGIWGGISAGPVVGHWMGSFTNAALFQFSSAACAFILALTVREDFQPHAHPEEQRLSFRSFLVPGLAVGFVNVHYAVVASFLILHLAHYGNSGPAAFSAYAFLILFSRFFLGSLPDKIHPAITFYVGITLMAIGLLIIASGPRPAIAITGAALLGLGFSFPWSSVASTTLRRTPPQSHGFVVSVLSAFYDLFVGASSLVAGRIAEAHGYASAFLMATVALLGAAIAGHYVFRGMNKASAVREEEYAIG